MKISCPYKTYFVVKHDFVHTAFILVILILLYSCKKKSVRGASKIYCGLLGMYFFIAVQIAHCLANAIQIDQAVLVIWGAMKKYNLKCSALNPLKLPGTWINSCLMMILSNLTLKVLVATIDALGHCETG